MTPSQQAKAAGLRSLQHMAELSGTSTRTLHDWHHRRPTLFAALLRGCVVKHREATGL